jgi:hypothetical protein
MRKWKEAWSDRFFRNIFFLSAADLAIVLFIFTVFLTYAENREGYHPNDFIIDRFVPLDISIFTFTLTYFSSLLGIIHVLNYPHETLRTMQAYSTLILLRMLTMYLVPLEPPADIIPLKDYFLRYTVYSGRDNLKDLFFSGHTATLFLFYLISQKKFFRIYFLLACMGVGTCVILQHVHYTIDVIAAPFFAWVALAIQKKISGVISKYRNQE